MKRGMGLARQLAVAMASLSVLTIVVSTAAFYLVYAVLEHWRLLPPLPPGVADTTRLDIVITLALCLLGLVIAVVVALWLARRIVRPLSAVGTAARQLARGELATRVPPMDDALGETAALIADFNAMADRLQRMADDVSAWNAQIAHELRTPLTILQGRLQGAQDGLFPLGPALIDGLLAQVAGLTRLVEDLRSVSLAESGRLELILSEVDLAAEFEELAPTLRSMLEPAGFQLELALESGMIRADSTRIRQAILALVDNVRRHARPCTVVIRVSRTADSTQIAVEDRGPGLPAELASEAFDQFVRGRDSTTGSGLGLAVVRGIARAHGGDVLYHRSADTSAFRIVLPTLR